IDPAQPPLPTARSLPFHVTLPSDDGRACPPETSAEAGSQTSILMFESVDGLSVAATRQKAGRLFSVPLNGVAKEPAGSLCAIVSVGFGRESAVRPSHVAPCADGAIASAATSTEYLTPSTE